MNYLFKEKAYRIRVCILLVADIIVINICSLLALLVRFDFRFSAIDETYLNNATVYSPINTLTIVLILWLFRLYSSVWTYASVSELKKIVLATATNFVVQTVCMHKVFNKPMPRSYYIIYALFLLLALMCLRFSYRAIRMFRRQALTKNTTNVLIVGAGQAGLMLAKEIQSSTYLDKKLIGFIDDNRNKRGKYLMGMPILGNRYDIADIVGKHSIDEIYVAIPSLDRPQLKEIFNICNETGAKVRSLPGVYQLVNGEVSISKLRNVQIEDLLGRDTISVDMSEIGGSITGKTVLVTGGGGSIGSELSRQIASYSPKELIIVDIYENNAYEIQQELKRKYGDKLKLTTLIASVRNTHRMESIFEKYRPDIVFHAAAHKHVPLMEDSPCEAIKNNVFGTYKTAMAAGKYGAKRFVLISTDKAVNPTNIMGASKRLCEMIVQYLDKKYETEYVAVRFGNVLGSNGSVIPLFKKQIEEGGPVTVTHKEIIRYFMTIPEAVSLVLQAGTYAQGGEIFVLDMGEPVKIDTLARNLIRLSGYEPDVDIKIEYTGLRPGEKLYEELLMDEEGMQDTANKLIHIGKPIDMDYDSFVDGLMELKSACEMDISDNMIKEKVKQLVPTYILKK
ncbi:MAG: nucleoside-diphosphate sugar epimerase/dehydratase [Lachnospiraceae bacterium]|nr:nucleoside-diphosphate sugar epimerase/dehydratase [Lachnospiraceae bacterium]